MLLGTLGANLLGNLLIGRGINIVEKGRGAIAKSQRREINREDNFELQKYDQNQLRFNGVYSRDNLSKIKDGAYVINLDEHSDIGTNWVALCVTNDDVTYFDSFSVKHIPKEIKEFINNKNITTNIFRIKAYDSIMCGYFCIGFIDLMLKGKTLTEYTNLFLPK